MGKKHTIKMRGGEIWGCPGFGAGWMPWRKRADHDLLFLNFPEFFSGANDAGQRTSCFIRMFVLIYLVLLCVLLAFSALAASLEHNVLHHRCEHLFDLWRMTFVNLWLYWLMLIAYILVVNDRWFRNLALLALIVQFGLVIWAASVKLNMPEICNTFYHIKYPFLKTVVWCNLCFNLGSAVILSIYQIVMACGSGPSAADPLISTTIFWKEDDTWTPPLFETAEVKTYKVGVNKWNKSAEERVATLQSTLDVANVIQKDSELQTQMMHQMSDLVGETEKKASKTMENLNEQTKLIGKFQDTFEEVKVTLDNLDQKGGAGLEACTSRDACLWTCLILMCCGSFVCLNLGFHKWADMMGLTILE